MVTVEGHASRAGMKVGSHELVRLLGRGGMGEVWLARQAGLHRFVALKLMAAASDSAASRDRFRREAHALARVRHPHVVPVHEVGESDGSPYYTMDYIEGDSLAHLIQKGPLSSRRAAKIGSQLADALAAAHARGIVHRDVKPSNVIVAGHANRSAVSDGASTQKLALGSKTSASERDPARQHGPARPDTDTTTRPTAAADPREDRAVAQSTRSSDQDDDDDHVYLVDFGIAHVEEAATLTRAGEVLGTTYYMAPELARGDSAGAGPAADIWGVGVTLYEMVTGQRAFDGGSVPSLQMAVLERDPEPVRKVAPSCPRDLETIILHCLEKDSARRYRSARELADDLSRFLADQPIRARRSGLTYRARKHMRRHRIAWLVGVSTALIAAVVVTAAITRAASQSRARERAAARDLVREAHARVERGDHSGAWVRLREVERRYSRTPALVDAYWVMIDLAQKERGESDGLREEVWLRRLLAAGPSAAERARAEWKLGRIYDKHGLWDRAAARYAAALKGALPANHIEDARLGLAWSRWLRRRIDSHVQAEIYGAVDVDGDGRDEIIALAGDSVLLILGLLENRLVVERRWRIPPLEPGSLAARQRNPFLFSDLNGDGRLDLVVVRNRCTIYDLADPAPRRVLSLPGCDVAATGDVDGDGRADLIVAKGQPARRLVVHHMDTDWKMRSVALDDLVRDETDVLAIATCDLDGDGANELVYASGPWTRYDVRVTRVAGGSLRVLSRLQLGAITGLGCLDMVGDGRKEILAVKSHQDPSPRLFEADPFLGPSGPILLRFDGEELARVWMDGLVPANGPRSPIVLLDVALSPLGPLAAVRKSNGMLRFYLGPGNGVPRHRDLQSLARIADGGVVAADVDGDGKDELVFSGDHVVIRGVGPIQKTRGRADDAAGWLAVARKLREAGALELAQDAYRAAEAKGANAAQVAFERGLTYALAERWQQARARYDEAQNAGLNHAELWRARLRAAEAESDWHAALDAARRLGDHARVASIRRLLKARVVFAQDFAESLRREWRVREPMSCRAPVPDALGLSLLPGDRALELPFRWDGTSLQLRALVTLHDLQYNRNLALSLVRDDAKWRVEGALFSSGGGGRLDLNAVIRPGRLTFSSRSMDWRVFPPRVVIVLAYVAHLGRWELTLEDLAGRRLLHTAASDLPRPEPGTYRLGVGTGNQFQLLAATVVDLHRIEARARAGSFEVLAQQTKGGARAMCTGDLAAAVRAYAGARDPGSQRRHAFALARLGRTRAAGRALRRIQTQRRDRKSASVFEFQEYRPSQWEALLARLILLDESLAFAAVKSARLMPLRDYGVLLRRIAYQQFVDSGQTQWRSALVLLRRATQLAPADAHGWYYVGYCHFKLGDAKAARAAFERAFNIDPNVGQFYAKQGGPAILLAKLAGSQNELDDARVWLARAHKHGANMDIARHDPVLKNLLDHRK